MKRERGTPEVRTLTYVLAFPGTNGCNIIEGAARAI
jgi:hypothetical protein